MPSARCGVRPRRLGGERAGGGSGLPVANRGAPWRCCAAAPEPTNLPDGHVPGALLGAARAPASGGARASISRTPCANTGSTLRLLLAVTSRNGQHPALGVQVGLGAHEHERRGPAAKEAPPHTPQSTTRPSLWRMCRSRSVTGARRPPGPRSPAARGSAG